MSNTKQQLYDKLIERDGLICGICDDTLTKEWILLNEWRAKKKPKRTSINIDIDHKIPYSKTGGHRWGDINNLRVVYRSCNNKKADMLY